MTRALVIVAFVGCAAGAREIALAKRAHYHGDRLVLFREAKAVAESKYQLAKSDEISLGLETVGKWYTPDGMAITREGGANKVTHDLGGMSSSGYDSLYPDGSIHEKLVVQLLPDGDDWVVKVTPIMRRFHAGSPLTEPIKENDASQPGWTTGKVDQLAYAIYERLKPYEAKPAPPRAPLAPDQLPPPPDEPKPTPADAGQSAP